MPGQAGARTTVSSYQEVSSTRCLFAAISRGHTVATPQTLAERTRSTQLERTHEPQSPAVRYLQQPVYSEEPPHHVLSRRSPRSTRGPKELTDPTLPRGGPARSTDPHPHRVRGGKVPTGLWHRQPCVSVRNSGPLRARTQQGTPLPPHSRARRPAPPALPPSPSGAHVRARSPTEGHREGPDTGPRRPPWTGRPATCDTRGEDGPVRGFLPRAARGHGGADTQEH